MFNCSEGVLSSNSATRFDLPVYLFILCLILMGCSNGSDDPIMDDSQPSAKFTLSGTVAAPANAAVDWDVRNTGASNPNGSNNALSATQPLVTPVILAGHANLAGDISDFYSISLLQGQTVTLYVADSDSADLDLYLYNNFGEMQNSAMGDNEIETLEITADADYIVEVRIVDPGAQEQSQEHGTNYNMVIRSGSNVVSGARGMRLSDDFVPGEMIVRFSDESIAAADKKTGLAGRKAQAMSMTLAGGNAGRAMRMRFDSQSENAPVMKSMAISKGALKGISTITDPERMGKQRTLEVIKAYRQREDVLYAEPNYILKTFATPNDTYFNLQWHFDQIHLSEAWDLTTGSADVIVAVVDNGVLTNHPDLASKLTGTGYDFVSDEERAGDGDGIDDDPDDPGDKFNIDGSSSFHGTHVAGIVAAATGNDTGVAGASWLTRVMAVRAIGMGGIGTDYDVIQGVRYAAGLTNDSNSVPDQPADIINLSLGGENGSDAWLNTVQDVVNQGVIIIAAAGNESSSQPFYPASYESVISVSAVDYASNLAYYSSFGDTIDVAAPGGDASTDLNDDGYGDGVLSTLGNDRSGMIEMGYGFYQGTSMAAPHVAGVVALMKALRPDLTASDLIALLAGGEMTNDIGRAELFGAGLIDAQKAVLVAQSGDLPTLFSVTPSLLSLGAALSAATITVEKIGNDSGELSITDISSDVPWLSVTPEAVDSDGIGTYTITGDRSELTNGTYNGTITFVSNVNTSTMSVSMLVSAAESSPDAGLHHILLIDANDQEAKYVLDVQAQDGVYAFTFTDVEPGDYFLFAGTDLDNDGMLGDSGEVLGAYLSLDKPDKITVDENKSGLDFISTFNNRIGESQPVAIVQRQRPPKTVNGR